MLSWWYSLRTISLLSIIARWSIAVLGFMVLALGWRQSNLQNQTQVAEKREADKALAEANRKIEDLQPEPLKDRVLAYLKALDPQILKMAKATGQRGFKMQSMTDAQFVDMQKLCEEDSKGQFITMIPTTTVMIGTGGAGTKGRIPFGITDELLK